LTGGIEELRRLRLHGAVGELFEHDTVHFRRIAVRQLWRRLRQLLPNGPEDGLLHGHHVFQVFGDGPAVRGRLELPLCVGQSAGDVKYAFLGLGEIRQGLVDIGGL